MIGGLGDLEDLGDAAADLLLGARCVACERPGRPLCPACADALADLARTSALRAPGPLPAGLAPSFAAASYDGAVRALVVAHKERRVRAARASLVRLLAAAVSAALDATPAGPDVVLVPVPSHPGRVRERGDDPTGALVAGAGRLGGWDVVRLLRLRPGVADQSGLGAAARHDNLAGSMAVRPAVLRRLARSGRAVSLVVCDDVLTTGSTLGEAQRALEAVGGRVVATAAVAATPRRWTS